LFCVFEHAVKSWHFDVPVNTNNTLEDTLMISLVTFSGLLCLLNFISRDVYFIVDGCHVIISFYGFKTYYLTKSDMQIMK